MAESRIQVGPAREGAEVCPVCRDALESAEVGPACSGCGVRLHRECGALARRCPTLGCGVTPGGAPRPYRAPPPAPAPERARPRVTFLSVVRGADVAVSVLTLMSLMTAIGLGWGLFACGREAALAWDADDVQARVSATRFVSGWEDDPNHWEVEYAFTDVGGVARRGSRSLNAEEPPPPLGSPLSVHQSRLLPAVHRAASDSELAGGLIVVGLCGPLMALLGVFWWRLLRGLRARVRAVRHGPRVVARVTGHVDTGWVMHEVRQGRLQWEYQDPAGRSHRGESAMRDLDEVRELSPGQEIAVYLHPERPEASFWEGERP